MRHTLTPVAFMSPQSKSTSLGPLLRTSVAMGCETFLRVVSPPSTAPNGDVKTTAFGAHGSDSYIDYAPFYDNVSSAIASTTPTNTKTNTNIIKVGLVGTYNGPNCYEPFCEVPTSDITSRVISVPCGLVAKTLSPLTTAHQKCQIFLIMDQFSPSNTLSNRILDAKCDFHVHVPTSTLSKHPLNIEGCYAIVLHNLFSGEVDFGRSETEVSE